jgi:hypothetical protein
VIRRVRRQVGMLGVVMVVMDVDGWIEPSVAVETCGILGSSMIMRNSDALFV